MTNKILFTIVFLATACAVQAQTLFTKTGNITFTSNAPMEKIEAANKSVACILDAADGSVKVALNIKSFVFDKQLMQEHFNENYMESDKYPKATFMGKLQNIDQINFKKDGAYQAKATGKMTIHGVTKNETMPVTITVKNGNVSVVSNFKIALADYKIEIPSVVSEKISKEVAVNVQANLKEK